MDSEPRHPYEKLPLPAPRSTRLLTILPGSFKDTIECSLEVVDLDEKPDYVALSYVWNPPDLRDVPPVEVVCNGVPVEVTPNLGAALRRLRRPKTAVKPSKPIVRRSLRRPRAASMHSKPTRISSPGKDRASGALESNRRIWIDALCINQRDLVERSNQVSFMGDIYSAAQNVIVWLGEDPGFGSEAMSLIRKVAKVARKEGNYDEYEAPVRIKKGLPPEEDKIWGVIDLLYGNPWFRRVWVVQEVARENGLVLLGSHEMPLLDVGMSSTWIIKKFYAYSLTRYMIVRPSQSIHRLKSGAAFLDALVYTSPMEASDGRDKIYALLGIYLRWANQKGLSAPSFRPDYEKPLPLVYADFVRYFLKLPRNLYYNEGSLRIILRNEAYVEKDGRWTEPEELEDDGEFPSWVPRWDQSRPMFAGLVNERTEIWKPSLDLTPVVGENRIWSTLSLKGFEISTISFLERDLVLWRLELTSDSYVEIIRRILDQVAEGAWRYQGDDELKDALARTLTGCVYKDETTVELFGGEDLDAYLTDELDTNSKGRLFGDWVRVDYSFFTTANGYMGLGARKMQLGDKICLFYGGEVLFILRPAEEGYRLVGECYVDGLMRGEALKMLETGEAKEQWFHLQ